MAPAFALGSLPHWLYGLPHGTAIPPAGLDDPAQDGALASRRRSAGCPGPSWSACPPVCAPRGQGRPWPRHWPSLYGAALSTRRGEARPQPRPRAGWAPSLLVLATTNVAVAVGTVYGRRPRRSRPALPPAGLQRADAAPRAPGSPGSLRRRAALARRRRRPRARCGRRDAGRCRSFAPRSPRPRRPGGGWRRLAATLAAEGPRHVYDPNSRSRLLTFLSGGHVIFSDPYQEILAEHALAVDGTPRVGWSPGSADDSERTLPPWECRSAFESSIVGSTVYVDFAVADHRLVEIDPTGSGSTRSEAAEASRPRGRTAVPTRSGRRRAPSGAVSGCLSTSGRRRGWP